MTPRGGGESEIIFIGDSDLGTTASVGFLSPSAKRFDAEAFSSLFSSLSPLQNEPKYSNLDLMVPFGVRSVKSQTQEESSLKLSFSQATEKPESLNLMFAIGSSQELGYHRSRDCFQIVDFPVCSPEIDEISSSQIEGATSGGMLLSLGCAFAAAMAVVATLM